MKRTQLATNTNDRRGATLVLIMLLLPVMLSIAALAINMGYMELTRTETQIAVDAATRAASFEYAKTQDAGLALVAAQSVAAKNKIANTTLPLGANDLVLGTAIRPTATGRYSYSPGGVTPNAVWIRSDTLQNNAQTLIQPLFPIPTPFNFRPLREAISVQCEMDIALVVDRSGSMAYSASEPAVQGVPPSNAPAGWAFGNPVPPNARWLDLIAGVQAFTNVLNTSGILERVSLVTYNHGVTLESPLSTNYATFPGIFSAYSLAYQAGGTAIGDGILVGMNSLLDPATTRPQATKVIVVMTDGIHNWGTSPDSAAWICKSNNVIIYSVTFSFEADQATMQNAAAISGGSNIHAVNGPQLITAFMDIARALPSILIQ